MTAEELAPGPAAPAAAEVPATRGRPRWRRRGMGWRTALLTAFLLVTVAASLTVGRYPVGVGAVLHFTALDHVDQTVLTRIRLPRIWCGILVGAGLAVSGAGYQTMFRNPLVSPAILGVSAGAGFGGALALLLGLPYWQLDAMAFVGGLAAAAFSMVVARAIGRDSIVLLVLAGVVVGSVFAALISVTEYLANPDDTLPAITFWLMGGLGRQQLGGLIAPTVVIAVSLVLLYAVRWPLTVLASGDEDARTLGVNTRRTWATVVVACTLITATTVSLAGVIGWVGLLVPHAARAIVGPAFGRIMLAAALLGAAFVVGVDDVARAATSVEIPLGILTSLIGAPFFLLVLAKVRRQWA
ncbi:FecCD family ABC transporter permease [Mycobacterium heidelbergense]|nr:iron ABC transporter permease [Mycobacterium heidelbergense]BBZ49881.1 iron(III) ABC transporter permease [Mycobacterium heidelbergense]